MATKHNYDELSDHVKRATFAKAVVVVVIHGDSGHGFSAKYDDDITPLQIAALMRLVAESIERQTSIN